MILWTNIPDTRNYIFVPASMPVDQIAEYKAAWPGRVVCRWVYGGALEIL